MYHERQSESSRRFRKEQGNDGREPPAKCAHYSTLLRFRFVLLLYYASNVIGQSGYALEKMVQ